MIQPAAARPAIHRRPSASRTRTRLGLVAALAAALLVAPATALATDTISRADFIEKDVSGTIRVGSSDGRAFSALQPFATWPGTEFKFGDVDSDGHADVVERDPTTFAVRVGRSNGTSFGAPVGFGTWQNGSEPWFLADVNGDSRVDLIGRVPSTKQIMVGLSDGNGFRAPKSFTGWNGIDTKFADVDDDGRADAVNRDAGTGDIQVGLSTGSSFRESTSFGTWGNGNEPWFLADVNNDGCADLIGRDPATQLVLVGLSNKTSFAAPVAFTGWRGTDSKFADVDGDGRADIVDRNQVTGEVQVGLSTGTTFAPSAPWATAAASSAPWYLSDAADIGSGRSATPTPAPDGGSAPPAVGAPRANGTGGAPSSAKITLTHGTKVFTARFRGKTTITGRLADAAGTPIVGARLDVVQTVRRSGAAPAVVASPVTGAKGQFSYAAAGTATSTLDFSYAPVAGSTTYSAHAIAALHVSATPTLALSATATRRGRLVTFRGKVGFAPLPARGVRLVIEGRLPGQHAWKTAAVVATRAGGTYRWSHRFAAVATWTFRARVLGSSDLTATPGKSATKRLRVH